MLKLIGTPRSHFTRKVRLLLDHLKLPYIFEDVVNVVEGEPEKFGNNPTMGVPVLIDGDQTVLESDHIAAYIVNAHAPDDLYKVNAFDLEKMNLRAVMNGTMDNEVKIIMAGRTGLDPAPHVYFQKAQRAMDHGLAWLADKAELFTPDTPTYTEFHLISLWDHFEMCGFLQTPPAALLPIVEALRAQPLIAQSAPSEGYTR